MSGDGPRRRRAPVEMLVAGVIVTLAAGATSLDLTAGSATGAPRPTSSGDSQIGAPRHSLTAQGTARSATIRQDPRPTPSTAADSERAAVAPVSLRIESIDLEIDLTTIGRDTSGVLVPPRALDQAGWYTGSAVPGAVGPAVIAGHVDDTRAAGVFARLRDLVAGDRIVVTLSDGSASRFEVTGRLDVAKSAFPSDLVYGATPDPQLRLITCNGPYDFGAHHYANNLVITATATA